jgi:hypothetical protein
MMLKCILPKQAEFDSYDQFVGWLNEGYLTNETTIHYDFHVKIDSSWDWVKCFGDPLPESFHFFGAHEIVNPKIVPHKRVPQVTCSSERGNTNATTAKLGGKFYFNDYIHTIDEHEQIFPHLIVGDDFFKKDETRKVYSIGGIYQSEEIRMITYQEFPNDQMQNWPEQDRFYVMDRPSERYILPKRKLSDFEEIQHLACWNASTGDNVDISDGREFRRDLVEVATPEGGEFLNSILYDGMGNEYTACYQYSQNVRMMQQIQRRQLEQNARL